MTDFEIIPRAQWGAKPPRPPGLTYMTNPDGWVVHYVGGPMQQDPTYAQSVSAVYNLQQGAFDGDNGEVYIDIPYNFLIDLNGRIFEGRGWQYKSGANGSSNYNGHAWAVCVLMGPGDGKPLDKNHLTQEAKDALSWLTREGVSHSAATSYVKGHRDVYATHCPGDECYAFVPYLHAHLHDTNPVPVPVPPNTESEDMTLIAAPKWQQTKPSRTPTVGLGDNNTIVSRNGARFVGQEGVSTPVPVPAGAHLIGIFETFDAAGNKEGFTVQATKDASGNPDFHYPWVKQ